MITVRYNYAGSVHTAQLSTFCPECACEFEPEHEQSGIDAPVEVHCVTCGALALRWLPPPPPVVDDLEPDDNG